MLAKLAIAFLLMAFCVTVHAMGLIQVFRWVQVRTARGARGFGPSTWRLLRVASWTVLLHLIQIVAWAAVYSLGKAIPDFTSAAYFSAVTYTTTGYGDIVLPEEWRLVGGFGMRVLAFDPFPSPEWAREHGIEYTDAQTLARESDVISLHTPLTPETRHVINEKTLELLKMGTVLINVSRGALIDTTALIGALKSGRLGGVALDVYEEEEGVFFEDLSGQILQDDELARLLTFPNVLITAHQAFLTAEALGEIARVTIANLSALGKGEPFLDGTALT